MTQKGVSDVSCDSFGRCGRAGGAVGICVLNPGSSALNHFFFGHQPELLLTKLLGDSGSKSRYQNGTLASGNMDQNPEF